MTQEEFDRQLSAISDQELADSARAALTELCETRGKSFIMPVPARPHHVDVIFAELIKRFKEKL